MFEGPSNPALTVFIVGALTVGAMLLKSSLERIGLPSLIGFLALGLLIRSVDASLHLFMATDLSILMFLGKVGLVALLFRIGLESNLRGLLHQLKKASLIWLSNIVVSGALGFGVACYLLQLGTITSLVVATAFTATSVGISVSVWQEMKALQSSDGELMLDVAELDDISAIFFMALLFAVLPHLRAQLSLSSVSASLAAWQTGMFLLKLTGFGLFCFLFSWWIEKPITFFFRKLEPMPDPMLTIAGIGFMIAGLAEWLGFSVAIGAFFAGLIFSRDPETVKLESSFLPVYDLFYPFFFISIGLQMDPALLHMTFGLGAVLTVTAIGGKLIGAGLPVYFLRDWHTALLIGTSMVPRAEIAMVIIERGHSMGTWVISTSVYNAMVLVCAVTCVLAPWSIRHLLKRPPIDHGQS